MMMNIDNLRLVLFIILILCGTIMFGAMISQANTNKNVSDYFKSIIKILTIIIIITLVLIVIV